MPGSTLYQETCQLGFQNNVYAPTSNADVMFAYGPPEEENELQNAGITFTNEVSVPLNQGVVNFHTFQEDQQLAFTGSLGRPGPT